MRRELPTWHAGALPWPSVERSRKARQEYGAAATKLYGSHRALAQEDHCGVDFAQQAHWKLLRTAEALQPQATVLGGIAFPRSRLIEALCINDHIVLAIERFRDRGQRPSPAAALMDSCLAACERARATGALHKQVRDAGRATVQRGLLDGNRGTLSAFPCSGGRASESPRRSPSRSQSSLACDASGVSELDS